jgi:hypothetical protein
MKKLALAVLVLALAGCEAVHPGRAKENGHGGGPRYRHFKRNLGVTKMVATTKHTASFAEWFEEYRKYSLSQGIAANFPEEWEEDYEAGKTPEQAFKDAWD